MYLQERKRAATTTILLRTEQYGHVYMRELVHEIGGHSQTSTALHPHPY